MNAAARHATLLAVALAACSPAAEQRRAGVSADTAASTARTAPAFTDGERAADSVRGVVERIGSDPTTQLVVRGADGAVCALRMTAAPPFEGLEVALWGTRDRASATMLPGVACTFAAARYAVRAVDGIAAADGVLRAQGNAYALETADGMRRPLRDVPAALRTQVGARIYWAGPLDRAPAVYGVLVPAP
ncbi:MAG: hypothetical protein C0497_07550 [Gemmatimonas sp.]|nr:hypothetical protein [Gemmatimonas sp.]